MGNGETVREAMDRGVKSLPVGTPKIFMAASGDPVSPYKSLKRYVDMTSQPAQCKILENTKFTLEGKEVEIAQSVLDFVLDALTRLLATDYRLLTTGISLCASG